MTDEEIIADAKDEILQCAAIIAVKMSVSDAIEFLESVVDDLPHMEFVVAQ